MKWIIVCLFITEACLYCSRLQIDVNDSISSKAEALSWCDGLLLVYSITDRDSFNFIKKAKQELQSSDTPVLLIGMWQENDKVFSFSKAF